MLNTSQILESIRISRKDRERAIRQLYNDQKLLNGIKKVIGSQEKDYFTEIFDLTLVQFMKNVLKNKDFLIESNLNSYLFGIARNLHYQKHRNAKPEVTSIDDYDFVDQETTVDLIIMKNEKRQILEGLLESLGEKCKKVLSLWSQGIKMKNIALELDYSSAIVARRKKFTCLKKLNALIMGNEAIKNALMD